MSYIREPAVSGMFYPGNSKTLKSDIERYLSEAVVDPIDGNIIGIISPHAGYIYSGPVAAYGFKAIAGHAYDTVIVIAPSHKKHFEGAAIIEEGGFKTPLGIVEVDEETAGMVLKKSTAVRSNIDAHREEHSLEVQLPFLQTILKSFKLVPLIMGTQDYSACEALSEGIYEAVKDSGKHILIVGSTDLSHYYSYGHAVELDSIVTKRLDDFDMKGLAGDLGKDKCEACGAGPMITTMMLSRKLGAKQGKVLKYANSGDTSGDKSTVVGYVSAIFYNKHEGKFTLNLSEKDKKQLKELARNTIEGVLFGKQSDHAQVPEILKEKRGVFVTLKIKGELKGCIGYIRGVQPLYETVKEMAIQAAFHDPRFAPLEKKEWKDVDIEISVLTPMKKIKNINEIEVGIHGLYIEKGHNSGLLLPQVATENRWNREVFLEYTCWKAGLPNDAWKSPDTDIYIFSADIF
jgi:MEMO1 family protein